MTAHARRLEKLYQAFMYGILHVVNRYVLKAAQKNTKQNKQTFV